MTRGYECGPSRHFASSDTASRNSACSLAPRRPSGSAYPFRSLYLPCRTSYISRMKWRGSVVAVTALVLVLCCLAACSRSQGAPSAAPVTGTIARAAAQQQIQPQPSPQSTLPTAPAPKAPATVQPQTMPAKTVASDRTQEFTVAQRKYRLLIRPSLITPPSTSVTRMSQSQPGLEHG
jgi:hypothetical protein